LFRSIILKVNQAFTSMTGYSADEAIGKTPKLLSSGQHNQTFYATMKESLNKGGSWQGEIWNRRKNGEIYPVWLTITAIYGDDGAVLHYVATQTDISQQKSASEQIEQLVFYDPLTHLANRRLLKDRLHLALMSSNRNNRHGALLFIDVDHFKTLNDTLGHNMGDLLLKQIAQRLMNCVRESDTVARLGGDEFVVMLEDLDEQAGQAAIQTETLGMHILAVLNAPYQLIRHDYHSSCSIGATLFYNHQVSEDDLFKHVDIAMYQAKHQGRNTLCFFDKAMQTKLIERTALETELREALAKSQFRLYYQMQNTHDGQTVGAEALIRWQHPEMGLIPPNKFIPLAEETGLILSIGQWVLETACAQLKAWEGHPLTRDLLLAVNVSARQFHQADFVEKILHLTGQFAINPRKLKLELTESLVLINITDTISKMNALRDVGIRFSLDDFGTGYSSLSHLTRLPLDQLKIDRSFIQNIGSKPSDAVIVQTIIGMTETLGIEVIAEGVETELQRAFLEENGCGLCQGFLFSQPVPLQEFEAMLGHWPRV
ncbi:MAG: EAL domain-containing protein, partial [Methylovulum sp.]|nr:EAL domain-containing protein [Methylovulum sp.]